MGDAQNTLVLNDEHVHAAANDTLDKLGIAKNSREEKIRARDNKLKQDAESAQMARLYREHVLGEKPKDNFVALDSLIGSAPKNAEAAKTEKAEEPVMGD
jgi:hypothetical protein